MEKPRISNISDLNFDKDFDLKESQFSECPCGKIISIYHQKDEHPEYYTYVTIKCPSCTKMHTFEIPVN